MTNPSIIAIVTPALNAEDTIERTILSIVSQAGDFDLSLHVQDGGSKDGTIAVLEKWQTLIASKTLPVFCRSVTFSFSTGKDGGLYDAIARGFNRKMFHEDTWLGWINADDLLLPGTCALLASIDATPGQRHMKWIGGTAGVVKNEVIIATEERPLASAIIKTGMCDGKHWGFVQQEGVFFRNRVWTSIDTKREFSSFKYAGDWNLWRCMAEKYRFFQANRPLGLFRVRPGQISQQFRIEYEDETRAVIPAGKRIAMLRQLVHAKPERSVLTYSWPAGVVGFRTENLLPTVEKWLESRIGPRHDANWQFPARTEHHAFNAVWSSMPVSDDTIYFGFPWATLIDTLHAGADATELMDALKQTAARKRAAARVVTVCQHVRMMAYRDLFDLAGVTEIYWSHSIRGMRSWPGKRPIALHAFPLFPVQIPVAIETPVDEDRRYLYNFVGAGANTWYLSEVRTWILEELASDPRGVIIGRADWHYDKVVYDHQIRKTAGATDALVDETASDQFRIIIAQSTFTLCPSGSGPNSIRLWEAIGAGSIPVILADTYATPGDRALWTEAVVFCAEEIEAVRALPNHLAEIAADPERLARKQRALKQLWALYGPDNFISDIRTDAFRYTSMAAAALNKRESPKPLDETASQSRLKIGFIGSHANRTPLSYPAYQPFLAHTVEVVKNLEQAQIIVAGFDLDIREHILDLVQVREKNPTVKFVVISEEPLWDSVWSIGFREKSIQITEKGVSLEYAVINHTNSAIFDFRAIPYFLTTDGKYLARYNYFFSRNAAIEPEVILAQWRASSVTAAFYAEKRVDVRYNVMKAEAGIQGLSVFRSEIAAAMEAPGVMIVGQGWGKSVKRQDLPDWHLDKLVALDRKAFIVSAIENTHQNSYVTEKIFDAFSVQALPLYYAGKDHRIHRIIKGGFVNLYGKTAEQASAIVNRLQPTLELASAWCAAQSDLARLTSDPALLATERSHVSIQIVQLLSEIVSGNWPKANVHPVAIATAATEPVPPIVTKQMQSATKPEASMLPPHNIQVALPIKTDAAELVIKAKTEPLAKPIQPGDSKEAEQKPAVSLPGNAPSASIIWSACSGIGEAEGPFPQWQMPNRVRWFIDRTVNLVFRSHVSSEMAVFLRYRCNINDQNASILINGKSAGTVSFPRTADDVFSIKEIRGSFEKGENLIEMHFAMGIEDPGGSPRQLVLLLDDTGLYATPLLPA